MASNADQHAAVVSAAPSDSPVGAKKAGAAAAVWKLPAAAAVPVAEVVENPIMDAHSWPALPGLSSPPPPPPPHAGPTAKASPKAASPAPTGAATSPVSLGNPGAPDASHGNDARVRNPVARRALVMPAADGLEKSAPAPEPSPVYVPNARSNGADPHQNGRPGSHHHGRGGGYGGGNRRGNGGGGGRRGSEHHGGFDGQRRGGGRRDGHGPVHQLRGHQPTYIKAPVVAGAPPPPPPFVSPATPQTPPYGPPMGFHDMSAHVYYFPAPTSEGIQGLPFVPLPASPQAVLIDPSRKNLLEQIEYYFSDDNLCKDLYLRQHMDGQGWVPLSLIAGFRQVQKITNNIQFILETVMLSNIVEVQF
ncbi:La-related protein 1C [Zea mays]|uniref:La-related protein 1C n=1 Tax=Zea mays TaxID=4577 RepID=A0A1D6PK56_MAIZE|nr:La-related protein 1C [Zea mays]